MPSSVGIAVEPDDRPEFALNIQHYVSSVSNSSPAATGESTTERGTTAAIAANDTLSQWMYKNNSTVMFSWWSYFEKLVRHSMSQQATRDNDDDVMFAFSDSELVDEERVAPRYTAPLCMEEIVYWAECEGLLPPNDAGAAATVSRWLIMGPPEGACRISETLPTETIRDIRGAVRTIDAEGRARDRAAHLTMLAKDIVSREFDDDH